MLSADSICVELRGCVVVWSVCVCDVTIRSIPPFLRHCCTNLLTRPATHRLSEILAARNWIIPNTRAVLTSRSLQALAIFARTSLAFDLMTLRDLVRQAIVTIRIDRQSCVVIDSPT